MAHDPGYIKGYLPGIRENGGQYTHAAIWTVIALARLGMGDEAMELFHLINPINHMRTPEACRALPRRAVRRRRRRLRAPDARRPRRLDLVHRLGGMDVSGGGAGAPRAATARRDDQHQSLHSDGVAGIHAGVADRRHALSLRRREPGAPVTRRRVRRARRRRRSIPTRFRCATDGREHEVRVVLGARKRVDPQVQVHRMAEPSGA